MNNSNRPIDIRRITAVDDFNLVDDDVFDGPLIAAMVTEFVSDERHYMIGAYDGDLLIGMASSFRYVHPDKPSQMFINEVGVSARYRRNGIGSRLVHGMIELARDLGCTEAWVATEVANTAAIALYESTGIERESDCALFTIKLDQ